MSSQPNTFVFDLEAAKAKAQEWLEQSGTQTPEEQCIPSNYASLGEWGYQTPTTYYNAHSPQREHTQNGASQEINWHSKTMYH